MELPVPGSCKYPIIRCNCTHDWVHDGKVTQFTSESASEMYPEVYFVLRLNINSLCERCHMFPWELVRNKFYKRRTHVQS